MKISAWSVIKNEAQFIGFGLMSILPYVDEVVYFDGNSTDGTLELLEHIKANHDPDNKIKVFRDKDFTDFKEDYVRVFNECMSACSGDYLLYIHPDMILTDPGKLVDRASWDFTAAYVNMRSFGGDDMELEITKGRTDKWKTIMRNSFGLHYWGYYGHPDEDMYFKHITGKEHKVHRDMRRYPFEVKDSGIKLWHMCECKPRKRREEKMRNVIFTNAGEIPKGTTVSEETRIFDVLVNHPRVHLQDGVFGSTEFKFEKRKEPLPEVFSKYKDEFDKITGEYKK